MQWARLRSRSNSGAPRLSLGESGASAWEASVQVPQLVPYLEFKACRATPLSLMRGQRRVDSLLLRMRIALELAEVAAQTADDDAAIESGAPTSAQGMANVLRVSLRMEENAALLATRGEHGGESQSAWPPPQDS